MNPILLAGGLVLAVATVSVAPAHAAGQVAAATADARFTALDRDDNDMLSLDEYAAEARAGFDAMDLDHNRNVTIAELDTADAQSDGEMSAAQKIALHDGNEDGILSVDEHLAAIEAQFKVVDVNADGSIDLGELKSGVPVRVPQP